LKVKKKACQFLQNKQQQNETMVFDYVVRPGNVVFPGPFLVTSPFNINGLGHSIAGRVSIAVLDCYSHAAGTPS
jgi:hypothetical protein